MNLHKTAKVLLYPHIALMILLLPVCTVLLIYSMTVWESNSPFSIASYILCAYTLTVWCFRIPQIIRFFKHIRNENKYILLWRNDTHLRMNISLYGTFVWNTAYALLQLVLGAWHGTFWYCSLAMYYFLLATMRFLLVRYTRRHNAGESIYDELFRYRICGIVFLLMNTALTLIIFFMIYWDRTFVHHEITTIAMAAYTFVTLTFAIVNSVRYRKYNSPVYSASKAISLASACVSMLTLEATMLTTFGDGTMDIMTRNLLLGFSGGAVSVFIITMAIYMIAHSTKRMNNLHNEGQR